jgi:hypothetical protein
LATQVEKPLNDLQGAGLRADPRRSAPPLGLEMAADEIDTLVEFLTPSFRSEEDIRELPALGVAAQSLHFLNYLIAEPIKAAALYRSGVLVQIPRPEAYAVHKLIVANRRKAPTS